MYKLSEVCKMTGVTRRTLQEYDKFGLLIHTDHTEKGYWLYDDSAIAKLKFILIFVEVGYKRKKIKKLLGSLESSEFNLTEEFDKVIQMLEEKRKTIDGMINFMKAVRIPSVMSETVVRINSEIPFETSLEMNNHINYKESLHAAIEDSSTITNDEMVDIQKYAPSFLCIRALCSLKDKEIDSLDVKTCFYSLAEEEIKLKFSELDEEEYNTKLKGMSQEEFSWEIKEGIFNHWLQESDQKLIDKELGDGCAEFLKEVVNRYDVMKPDTKKGEA